MRGGGALFSVLHIITGLNTGGAERVLYGLLQGGLAERFDCHVVSLMDDGAVGPLIKELGVPVASLGMKRGVPSVVVIKKLRQVVVRLRPDLIQGWMYHGNLTAWLAQKLDPGRSVLVWNVRQSLYSLKNEKFLTRQVIRGNWFLSKAPDCIVYNSHVSRKQHERFGFHPEKGQVIPNGIDVKKYHFSEGVRAAVRSDLHIPVDALVVGHVARFHPMKDHALFMRAAVRLAEKFRDLHILMCGRGVTLANHELSQLVPDSMRDRFLLLGERADIASLMNAMDILSSSSWAEAFPNVIGEAMACEVPCVATDVGDSAVIVGEHGVIVPPRDEAALAQGIESLLLMPKDKRRELGRRARKCIVDSFSLDRIVERYCELYERLLQGREGNH